MACYVDRLRRYTGTGFFKNKPSCHLWADSLEELHVFATRLGLKRAWFQDHPKLPHYDLVKSRRDKAVRLGAKEATNGELAAILKERRNDRTDAVLQRPDTAVKS
jgi:hypothetical protein